MTTRAQAQVAYQQALEGRRSLASSDDHELREMVEEDLDKHRREVEVAWLDGLVG